MTNLKTYEDRKLVDWYARFEPLFAAEDAIFRIVKARFAAPAMLDIGVGGGRTTAHFAGDCSSYLGIDYSDAMVKSCQERFPYSFLTADARDLGVIPDNSVDFALFSFNGIDYVPYEDRMKVFSEIKRVCRGYFAFSSHNLACARAHFSWRPAGNRMRYAGRFLLLRLLNFPLNRKLAEDYAYLNDGVHRFGLHTLYIRPRRQSADLQRAGFKDIRLFETASGREIDPEANCDDPYPYYLCRTD